MYNTYTIYLNIFIPSKAPKFIPSRGALTQIPICITSLKMPEPSTVFPSQRPFYSSNGCSLRPK